MQELSPKPPAPGSIGLTVDKITFHKHPSAEYACEAFAAFQSLGKEDKWLLEYCKNMTSVKQAKVTFGNGWSISIVTMIPVESAQGFNVSFIKGDERIPTYEVMIFGPEGQSEGPWGHQSVEKTNSLIAYAMRQTRQMEPTV